MMANKAPNRKKFEALLIALPSGLVSFPGVVISSPGFFLDWKKFSNNFIASCDPSKTYEYLTLEPGWITFAFSRSDEFIIAFGAKAKDPAPLSDSARMIPLMEKSF